MDVELIPALILFAFVSSATPGPNNVMLLAAGANFGLRRTLPHMFGIAIGFMVMIFCIGAGLIQIFDAYPVIRTALRVFSVAYLLFLAWKIATAAPPQNESPARNKNKPVTFLQAALFQWVNPKALTMALVAISTFTPPHHPLVSIVWVSVIFGVVNLPSITIWVVLGMQLRRWLRAPLKLRIFNATAAGLLLASMYPILVAG